MFPALAVNRPSWAPNAVHDLNIGGGIMWAFGDGLMMLFIVAVMLAYLTNTDSHATAGDWLEGVRRSTLASNLSRGAEPGRFSTRVATWMTTTPCWCLQRDAEEVEQAGPKLSARRATESRAGAEIRLMLSLAIYAAVVTGMLAAHQRAEAGAGDQSAATVAGLDDGRP